MTRSILPFFGVAMLTALATAHADGPDSAGTAPIPTVSGNDESGYPVNVGVRLMGGEPKYFVRYSRDAHDWSNITEYSTEVGLTRAEYEQNIIDYGADVPGVFTNLCAGAHAMADDGAREYWIVVWVNKDNTLLPCLAAP